ncbi:MAG: hypothetical protein R3B84_23085 [Zavarzinella sp.]
MIRWIYRSLFLLAALLSVAAGVLAWQDYRTELEKKKPKFVVQKSPTEGFKTGVNRFDVTITNISKEPRRILNYGGG